MKGASEGDGAVMRDLLWSPSFECAWGALLAGSLSSHPLL